MTKIDWYKPCAYNEPQKHLFHREARKRLKELAAKLLLQPGTFRVRSCKGGVAVSGEVILHSDHLYIQVCQPATGHDSGILIRTCKGQQDFTGGRNHFYPLRLLDDLPHLASVCRAVLREGGEP
jgi:hypothetical protein